MYQINTLIKPTHQCNMRCKYCFSEKYGYGNSLLDINALKKYLLLLSEKFKYINVVWHGGEPLLAPLDFYTEIYDYCSKIDAKFMYSLQTNGTLLDEKNITFFKNHDTNIGLSFDGTNNETIRGNIKKILSNINLLQKNGMFPGAILVVNQKNVNHLIEEYEYFKSLNVGMKINPMFNDGAAKFNDFLKLNPDEYIDNFVTFFKYWAFDTNCNINVSTCIDLVNLVVNEHTGVCTYNSCLGKWLCFDSNGHIYPCDRLCLNEYDLGDINDIKSIDEVFQNKNFAVLLKNSIVRREKCISNCEYFKNCYGGCNANASLNNEASYNISCYIQKGILRELKNYIVELNRIQEFDKVNFSLRKILSK